jgi:hypothetical protein
MNTATRCAYTALTLSPARASHTRQLPGGASRDPGLFFPLGVLPASSAAAGPSPFLAASRRNSYPGRSARFRGPDGLRVDCMSAHLSGCSSLP